VESRGEIAKGERMRNFWFLCVLKFRLYFLSRYLIFCNKKYVTLISDPLTDWSDEKVMGILLRFVCVLDKKYDDLVSIEKKLKKSKRLFFIDVNEKLQKEKHVLEQVKGTFELLIQGKF
jgi:hypothetical protein